MDKSSSDNDIGEMPETVQPEPNKVNWLCIISGMFALLGFLCVFSSFFLSWPPYYARTIVVISLAVISLVLSITAYVLALLRGHKSQKLKSKNYKIFRSLVFIVLMLIGIAWSYGIAKGFYYEGDYMIGFHPPILFAMPFVAVLLLLAAIFLFRKKSFWAFCFTIAPIIIIITLLNGRAIADRSWEKSINKYSDHNLAILEQISKSEIDRSHDGNNIESLLYDEQYLCAIPEFKWYCRQHIAAPENVFYGFRLAGIPHVRVQKIRHGYRGIAYLRNPEEFDKLSKLSSLDYNRTKNKNWIIWDSVHLP